MNAKEINFTNKAGKFFMTVREGMSPRWHDYFHMSKHFNNQCLMKNKFCLTAAASFFSNYQITLNN